MGELQGACARCCKVLVVPWLAYAKQVERAGGGGGEFWAYFFGGWYLLLKELSLNGSLEKKTNIFCTRQKHIFCTR